MNDFLHNLRSKQNKRFEGNRRQYPNSNSNSNSQYQGRNGKDNRRQQFSMGPAVETLSAALSENLPVIKTILEGISANQEKLAQAGERRARAEERKAIALENLVEYAGKLLSSSGLNISDFAKIRLSDNEILAEEPAETEVVKAEAEAKYEETEAKYEETEAKYEETEAKYEETEAKYEETEAKYEEAEAEAKYEEAEAKYEEAGAEAKYEETGDEDIPTRDDVLNMICGLREEGLTYDQIAKQLESESVPTFSGKGKWRGQTVHRLYQKMTS